VSPVDLMATRTLGRHPAGLNVVNTTLRSPMVVNRAVNGKLRVRRALKLNR